MMGRIFKVQVNIDDMCAELDTMRQDQHSEWLAGFRAGCRGRVPDDIDGPMLRGAQFGLACHASAEEFRQSRVAGGKARQSAHAQHMLSTCSAHAQHQTQHDAQLSNIQVSNIQKENIEEPTTTNQAPKSKKAKAAKRRPVVECPPTLEEVEAYVAEIGGTIPAQEFIDGNQRNGWTYKDGKCDVICWRSHYRTWMRFRSDKECAPKSSNQEPERDFPGPTQDAIDYAIEIQREIRAAMTPEQIQEEKDFQDRLREQMNRERALRGQA